MAVHRGNSGAYTCRRISSLFSCAVVICCVASVLSYETRSAYFVRSSETNRVPEAGWSSGAEFSCATRCSATKGCERAVITREEDGNESRQFCALENDEKLSDSHGLNGNVKLQKLGAFDFSERRFHFAQGKGKGIDIGKPLSSSCRNIFEENKSLIDGMYDITLNDGTKAPVYCVLSDIPGCGGGGWTLVMKINGSQSFSYHSQLWTNKHTHNAVGASGGLDSQELKSSAYWGVPITTGLCLGMRRSDQLGKYIRLPYLASSLHSVIADDQFRNTSLGPDTWKSLINGSYLYGFSGHDEGFNANAQPFHARIGIASSTIGSGNGVSILGFGISHKLSCGNFALVKHGGSSEIKLTTFGYILVQ